MKSKVDKKESKTSPLPSELASAAPNALPGTLIPGKKDWVVGKFGRVLPIVHMRQTGSHKVCRIDPSKTVHNLRRIKDDGDERPVSELTWNLQRENGEKVFVNGNKHEEESNDSDSSSSEETNIAPAIKKKKINSRRNEIENMEESEKMDLLEGKSNIKDLPLRKYLTKKLSDNEDGLKSLEVKEGFTSMDDNENVTKDTPIGNIDVADKDIKSLAQARSSKKKNKKKRKTSDSSASGQEDSIPHGLLDDSVVLEKNQKTKIKKEDQSTDLNENGSVANPSEKKKREKENNEDCETVKSGEQNNDKQKKKISMKKENQAKKMTSNKRRLQAAYEREASLLLKQSVIASALKNLDNNDEKVKKANHIKFDDEYEEEEEVLGGKEKKTEGKVGKQNTLF